jgi:hypothetical protein
LPGNDAWRGEYFFIEVISSKADHTAGWQKPGYFKKNDSWATC